MYQALTFLHSSFRWLVVISLLYAIFRSLRGYTSNREFTRTDNAVRHWTATIAHIQLITGIIFYTQSPAIRYFWSHFREAVGEWAISFYALLHPLMMLTAIVILTIGAALAKRKPTARHQFKTMLVWFSIAFLIIFIAVPWPFSPLAGRPYFR